MRPNILPLVTLFASFLLLAVLALPSLAMLTTPLAPVPDDTPYTHRYQTHQQHLQEAETKTRLMAMMQDQDKARTANMDLYNVTFYDLVMDIDPVSHILEGFTTVKAEVLDSPLTTLDLNLNNNMGVQSVTAGGNGVSYSHTSHVLTVTLDRTYQPGEMVTVVVQYGGNPDGSFFGWDSYNGDPLIWTLSEPYGARNWWPCKDLNIDKADSVDLHITVPDDLIVASNGLLVAETVPSPGKKTFHWEERYPIPTYLVSLAIHPYATFSNTYTGLDGTTTMPVDYYVIPAYLGEAQVGYPVTVDMLEAFAGGFGEYPFINEKYGHAHFPWGGGMEHQTLSSMAYYNFSEFLISHELGHQWFGDMITCADFHHIWLNEGFATWTEAYWREINEGPSAYREEMLDAAYYGGGTIYVENPDNFGDIFDANLSYHKASWIPHMLRGMLGDEVFFAGLRAYREAYEFDSATTEQFRDVFEEVSGRNFHPFFQQWIYGSGHPQYQVNWSSNSVEGGTLVQVRIEQTQAQPVFEMTLQLKINQMFGNQLMVLENDQRVQHYSFLVSGQVDGVDLDPNDWVLCQVNYGGTSDVPEVGAGEARLLANVPNPFNPSTTINYELPVAAQVRISVYDISGRLVRVLEEGSRSAGQHSVHWNGRDAKGSAQASGMYFVRLKAGGTTGVRKITLVQ